MGGIIKTLNPHVFVKAGVILPDSSRKTVIRWPKIILAIVFFIDEARFRPPPVIDKCQ